MKYNGVIFDLDGVILDSGIDGFEWADKIRINKAEEKGYKLTEKDALKIVRTSNYSELESLMNSKGMSKSELLEIEREVRNAKVELIEHGDIELFPNAVKVLDSFNVPVGLATNSPKFTAKFTLKYYGLTSCFDEVQALPLNDFRKYIEHRKPSQYMLQNIMNECNMGNPVMIGDSSSDVGAARSAGIDSVLVESYFDNQDLDPTYRVEELSEIKSVIE